MEHRKLTEKIIGCAYRVLMAVCMCVAAFAGGGSASGQKSEVGPARNALACEAGGGQRSFEYFNDFIVHIKIPLNPPLIKGVRGDFHHRILLCDVVIELNRGAKLPKDRAELRRIIYKTLKELLDLYGNRRKLKKEIKIRSNNFMDDEIIKSVYFTRFVLL